MFSRLAFSDCIRDGSDEFLCHRFQFLSNFHESSIVILVMDKTIVHLLVVAIIGCNVDVTFVMKILFDYTA